MRKLILKMSTSIDGFVAGPNGESDWIFRGNDKESNEWTMNVIWDASAHLMGSHTFADMSNYWPYSTEIFAAPMNEIPKITFSRSSKKHANTQSLKDALAANKQTRFSEEEAAKNLESWTNATVLTGELATEIAELKKVDGKPMVAHGGGTFARSLIELDLVDEYHLLVHPVILGGGMPIFTQVSGERDLKLIDVKQFPSGSMAHIYKSEH